MDQATRGWRWFVAESPRPRRIAAWAGAPWLVITTVCFGAFTGQFDASIVTLAFLFGPLVAVPFAATGSPLSTGLALTALPAGFALAATLGQKLLPRSWTSARVGAWLAAVAALVPAVAPAALVPALALLGFGLGVFTPANNAAVMAALPAGRAGLGGGLVNTTRGLGTALGIAISTFVLHTGGDQALRTTFAVLSVAAIACALATPVLRTGTPTYTGWFSGLRSKRG
jgi:MFS family permease